MENAHEDRERRRLGWRFAREAWLESGGDPERAKQLAEQKIKSAVVVLSVIWILIKIAIALIELWHAKGISDPGPQPDE